jgi:hypothetical protein
MHLRFGRRHHLGLIVLSVLLPCAIFAGAATATPADGACDKYNWVGAYKGADAGRLIIAFGSNRGMDYRGYRLDYRATDRCEAAAVTHLHTNFNIFNVVTNLWSRRPDIDDTTEEAEVWVVPMQPGDYEFYSFEIWSDNGYARERFTPNQNFSVPFSIKPNTSIYVGDFRAMEVIGRNVFGLPVEGGAYFMISDQGDRDLKIAKAHDPGVSNVEKAIPDAKALGISYFRPMF